MKVNVRVSLDVVVEIDEDFRGGFALMKAQDDVTRLLCSALKGIEPEAAWGFVVSGSHIVKNEPEGR